MVAELFEKGQVCDHRGQVSVQVGPYEVFPAGTMYLRRADLLSCDLFIPFHSQLPKVLEEVRGEVFHIPMVDFGGVPDTWEASLLKTVGLLELGFKAMPFCAGSHGRTGTFLASLIALLERDVVDPIEEVRHRHCVHAVETITQARAIFALMNQPLPDKYIREFERRAAALRQR